MNPSGSKHIELTRTDGQKCTLQIFDKNGQPMKLTKDYIRSLARRGWHGMDQIPPECISNVEKMAPPIKKP